MQVGMATSDRPVTAVVIGYGSIGRRHARVLASMSVPLVIVNRRASVRSVAKREHPTALVVADLETLDRERFGWTAAVAVIATWGPSHAALFDALVDRGVRRILCEKPMAASVHDAFTMAKRAERDGLFLALNHTIRYAGLVPALQRLAAEHELGEPLSVVIEGGAACLLTNGIHWIDFATHLFAAPPRQVISSAYGEPINPRSRELRFYGGTAVWGFDDRREAVISFSNRSSVRPQAEIYYRDGIVTAAYVAGADDEHVHVVARRRDRAAVARDPRITWTGPVDQAVWDGCLPGVRSFTGGLAAAAEELVRGESATCDGAVGAAAVSACVGALIAARERKVVDLPVNASGSWAREPWPIS